MENAFVTHYCQKCADDVVKLLEVGSNPPDVTREFTMYQIKVVGQQKQFVYLIFVQGSELPIAITKNAAEQIIRHPEFGIDLVNRQFEKR